MENCKLREIIEQAVEVVLNRSGDVDTEDGILATTDADAIIRLEMAIADGFRLDSDDVDQREAWRIQRQLDSMDKKIAPIQPTKEQRQWLDNESKRTGNSQASVIRQLIQREVDALN